MGTAQPMTEPASNPHGTGDAPISPETADSDQRDAHAVHEADRGPTDAEAEAAPTEVDPDVAQSYKAATERGAAVKGEGQIIEDDHR